MTEHYSRIRLYSSLPGERRLVQRERVVLKLYLPSDHEAIAHRVSESLDVYLRSIGSEPEALTEGCDEDREYFPLDADGWEMVRAELAPPKGGAWFLDELGDKQEIHFYLKRQCERFVELTGGSEGASGYGFFYRSRLPWHQRERVHDERSVVSFSWPTEYLEKHGPERMRELAIELAAHFSFSSGHAGLTSPHPTENTPQWNLEASLRHPGFDVPHGLTSIGSRVDGIHWLNFLGESLLKAMGGAEGLRTRLHSPDITMQEMGSTRVMVSLAPRPEAGDLYQGHGLPAYREFAHRVESYLHECPSYYAWRGYSHEETLGWWLRFLDHD